MNKPLYQNPFFQVLGAIAAGVLLGWLDPALAVRMKPLGTAFIGIIKLLVPPIVFFTVATGIAAMGSLQKLGRVGIKAVLCFEVLSLLALLTGLLAGYLLQPGAGFQVDAAAAASDTPLRTAVAGTAAQSLPATLLHAFLGSLTLQVLLAALVSGSVLAACGRTAAPLVEFGERAGAWLFRIVRAVLKAAPLAAFGAIAYTVGKYGPGAVEPLLRLLGALYLAMTIFVLVVLGGLARWCGVGILRLIVRLKEELMIVFGVASSVAAMPRLIEKLERAGCARPVVGVVIPAGYSFNLTGSAIYITLAFTFLAQAYRLELSLSQQLTILAVAMVTSKSASGVAGSAFIALAATLPAVPEIPESSLLFIVGIERLLKCRTLTNIIGNGVACLAVAAWTGTLDRERLRRFLDEG